jgi:hypothetical protein
MAKDAKDYAEDKMPSMNQAKNMAKDAKDYVQDKMPSMN